MLARHAVRNLRKDLSGWATWVRSAGPQIPIDSRGLAHRGRAWVSSRAAVLLLCTALFVCSFTWHSWHGRTTAGRPHAPQLAPAEHATALPKLQLPVWWFAPFLDPSSFGKEATQLVLSLLQSGYTDTAAMKISLLQMRCEDHLASSMDVGTHTTLTQLLQTNLSHHAYPAVVVCHNMPLFYGRPPTWASCAPCPPIGYQPAFAIARAMSETSRIPSSFVVACNSLDEVWVPAQYSRTALLASGVAAHKVHIVPPVVNTTFFDASKYQPVPDEFLSSLSAEQPFKCNTPVGDPSDHIYKFVSVFKWEARKGWDVLLNAYMNKFTSVDKVTLYVVTKPFTDGREIVGEVRSWVKSNIPAQRQDTLPCIHMVTSHLSDQQYTQLLAAMDAFVLPTRGEGFGLPIVEAMSMGLPVLATHYSGITDYLDSSVGFPLMYQEVAVPDTITQPWYKGSEWAEPDVHDLQRLMRYVVTHPQDGVNRGQAARQRILDRYSPKVMGKRLAAEFQRIEQLVLFKNATNTITAVNSPSMAADTATSDPAKSSVAQVGVSGGSDSATGVVNAVKH